MALNETAKVNPLTCVNGRFRWTSEFDLFQLFVQDILNVKARWTVPRGQCKQVKTNNITIRWYESQSVVLEGLMVEQYRSLLQKIAAYNPNSRPTLGANVAYRRPPSPTVAHRRPMSPITAQHRPI